MPWTATEAVTDEEDADENGNRKGDVCCNGGNTENCSNGNRAGEDEEKQQAANSRVEPDGVDWGQGDLVHTLHPPRAWEAVITGIGESDTRCCNHASLTHGESTHDSDSKDGKGVVSGQDLEHIGGPWLSQVRADDRWDILNGVGNDQLKRPSCNTANS